MLVIIDPALKSFDGHCYNYNKAIADELRRLGRSCVVLARRSMTSRSDELPVLPCFRDGIEEPISRLADRFYSDLEAGLHKVGAADRKTLFLHTCTPPQILASAKFLRKNPLYHLIILLRYSITINPTHPDLRNVAAYRTALAAVDHDDIRDRIKLTTDSHLLRDEYRLVTGLPIEVVPIPHVATPTTSRMQGPHTVAYLGNARSSKGFSFLPHATTRIRPLLEGDAWRAEFQANVFSLADHESVVAVAVLRNEPVTLFERELSPNEYDGLLRRSSLVLIPYSTSWYHAQTSGVFAEAIGAGRAVVAPRGTWMARQLLDSGAGVLFNPGDRVDFAGAVENAMHSIEELLERASKVKDHWCERHNPGAFVRALLQMQGPICSVPR